jgi:hypothetical protein
MRKLLVTLMLIGCVGAMPALADETADLGRQVLEANKQAVVTVLMVTSMSFGGEDNERESEATGTIIAPDGLTVLALSALDPAAIFAQMGEDMQEVVSKVKDVKILMHDGTEMAAEVVLRHQDQDLVFIRPTVAPEAPLAHVDITKAGHPQILDEVAALMQLGKVARRAPAILVARIEAVVERPRLFYVTGEHRQQAISCSPVFTLDGGFVGMGAMRAIRDSGGPSRGSNLMVVIVPAADIQEAMSQVPPKG